MPAWPGPLVLVAGAGLVVAAAVGAEGARARLAGALRLAAAGRAGVLRPGRLAPVLTGRLVGGRPARTTRWSGATRCCCRPSSPPRAPSRDRPRTLVLRRGRTAGCPTPCCAPTAPRLGDAELARAPTRHRAGRGGGRPGLRPRRRRGRRAGALRRAVRAARPARSTRRWPAPSTRCPGWSGSAAGGRCCGGSTTRPAGSGPASRRAGRAGRRCAATGHGAARRAGRGRTPDVAAGRRAGCSCSPTRATRLAGHPRRARL